MSSQTHHEIFISENIGIVGAIVDEASDSKLVLLLAHGAGAGMEHEFMANLAEGLCKVGLTVVRFNFPYMQRGQRRPDFPPVAYKTIEKLAQFVQEKYPKLDLILSGKSFGGRMSSQYVAKYQPDYVKGIVFFGFPLHAMGKPSTERAGHLADIKIPMLFLQGNKDKLADLGLLKPAISQFYNAELKILEWADHSFKAPKKSGLNKEAVYQWLVSKTKSWIDQNI